MPRRDFSEPRREGVATVQDVFGGRYPLFHRCLARAHATTPDGQTFEVAVLAVSAEAAVAGIRAVIADPARFRPPGYG